MYTIDYKTGTIMKRNNKYMHACMLIKLAYITIRSLDHSKYYSIFLKLLALMKA